MLHTLRHSPWQCDMDALLRMLQAGDDVLLLSDGVIAGVQGNRFLDLLLAAPISVHALGADIAARGLSGQISNSIIRVDYNDFVNLTVKHAVQMTW
nr:sulfurtransferase complex subunit TusB [uncultured Enterobacter sp.]